jgi:hypothetical protein
MTPVRRWCIVALGLALVIGTPLTLRALPAHDQDMSAATLLARVTESSQHPYSGYVESLGTLELPVADRFTDVGALFGERTRMRVWWQSPDEWRVDKVLATGETDLFHSRCGDTTAWDYEKNEVTHYRDPSIRLPRTSDLLPPEVVRRLLTDVSSDELSRLAPRRVAGRDALGLRLSPAAAQSSIDRVDIWADPETAIPLRVEVYALGDPTASFTSEFMSFSADRPDADVTEFHAPPGADISHDEVLDVADAANRYAPIAPPRRLAGLAQSRSAELRAVGVYGRGVTQMIAIPLWDRAAEPLREQLEKTPGVKLIDEGDILHVGPLSVLLTQFRYDGGGWLIAGTVNQDTVIAAARQLDTQTRYVDR